MLETLARIYSCGIQFGDERLSTFAVTAAFHLWLLGDTVSLAFNTPIK
jgi:hypothetical protein